MPQEASSLTLMQKDHTGASKQGPSTLQFQDIRSIVKQKHNSLKFVPSIRLAIKYYTEHII